LRSPSLPHLSLIATNGSGSAIRSLKSENLLKFHARAQDAHMYKINSCELYNVCVVCNWKIIFLYFFWPGTRGPLHLKACLQRMNWTDQTPPWTVALYPVQGLCNGPSSVCLSVRLSGGAARCSLSLSCGEQVHYQLEPLPSIEDRRQTDHVTVLDNPDPNDPSPWPWPMTLNFTPWRSVVMIHTNAKKTNAGWPEKTFRTFAWPCATE